MFSVITCYIHPSEVERLRKNIGNTIGVPFEFIAYDNRGTSKGICQVYNECAEKARFDNLCFVHEDFEFTTDGWGRKISEKLEEERCGVIGFAGSTIKTAAHAGWAPASHRDLRTNYTYLYKGKEKTRICNPDNEDFSEVVTLDGMCLSCTKALWQQIRFDEQLLKGFHGYDIDYTLASKAAGYRNYVCHTVGVKHFSNGKYDLGWWEVNQSINKKWERELPIYLNDISDFRKRLIDFRSKADLTNTLGREGIFIGKPMKYILGYIAAHPFNGRSYKLLCRYIRSRSSQKGCH